jgi:cold shock CspA family protein
MKKTQNGTVHSLGDRLSGFIRRTGVKEHLFFHADDCQGFDFKQLKKGDKVCFNVVDASNGDYAVEVTRLQK